MTANSPTEDGRKLTLFDLGTGEPLFSVTPKRSVADRIELDEKNRQVVIKVTGGGEFRYGTDGAIPDLNYAHDAYLRSTDYCSVILTAESLLKKNSASHPVEKSQAILEAVTRARALGADQNPAWKPTALKVQGMAHESLAQLQEAIACYEEALSLNPKIGVKRKLDALRKRS